VNSLLELVEDQQRDERLAGCVAQDVVAMVQEFPQRFAGHCGRRLRPRASASVAPKDRLLDLLGGRRGNRARIVDAHVDRAVAFGRSRGTMPARRIDVLPQARLAEEDR
jgi:hypothetical protein